MISHVDSLHAALALASALKQVGKATLFRGQVRSWPLLSSFCRRAPAEQAAAIERFETFVHWLSKIPALAPIANDEDSCLAVAQHYGLATNFVDFSTNPNVAAFFATHGAPPPKDDEPDLSCILCLDPDELRRVAMSVRITRPDAFVPALVTVTIPELWRIQAQHGVFLAYPFDASFERNIFDCDRIVFPTERDPAVLAQLIPLQDIYPTQKSELEIMLDQFFMRETMARGAWSAPHLTGLVVAAPESGIEAECFGSAGLPAHSSWSEAALQAWRAPKPEAWSPASKAPRVTLRYPAQGTNAERRAALESQLRAALSEMHDLRSGAVAWRVLGIERDADRILRTLNITWDGLRRWPFSDEEVVQALALVVAYGEDVERTPDARVNMDLAETLAARHCGEVIEVEIAMEDGSYTRGFASVQDLEAAVRDDFHSFLNDEWRAKIARISAVLQVAAAPAHTFDFQRLKTVFCTQIVPTQVVLRDEASAKARLYNPARASKIGLV